MVRSVFSIISNLTSLNVFLFCRKGCFSSRWLHNLFSSLAATEVGRLERYLLIYFGFKYGRNAPLSFKMFVQGVSFNWCPSKFSISMTGIGLELVKQFLALPTPPRNIFATYRSKERSGAETEKMTAQGRWYAPTCVTSCVTGVAGSG